MAQSCKFCLCVIQDPNFTIIEDFTKNMLDLVLLNYQYDDESSNVMCCVCSLKLFAAFEFKSACLYTENTIKMYVHPEGDLPLDIKDIYVKQMNDKQLTNASDDEKVCRLCMEMVTSEFTSIEEIDYDLIQCYIPEINFQLTRDVVVCNKCLNSLHIHTAFIKSCLKSLGLIENDYNDEESFHSFLANKCIQTNLSEVVQDGFTEMENILDKMEGHGSESFPPSENPNNVIDESRLSPDSAQPEVTIDKCDEYPCETSNNYNLKIHSTTQPDLPEVYECDKCTYTANNKSYFKRHYSKHEDSLVPNTYKCDNCDYETTERSELSVHSHQHEDLLLSKMFSCEEQKYECDSCSYESKDKSNFKKHYLKHYPSLLKTFKCEKCDYETTRKGQFSAHSLQHEGLLLSEMYCQEEQMYKCDSCSYGTKDRSNFKKHYLKHANPSLSKTYRCDKCDYETKQKSNLGVHCTRHKNPFPKMFFTDTQTYKCDNCSYETKDRSNFRKHYLKHTGDSLLKMYSSGVQMYKCDHCSYVSKDRSNFRKHYMKHADASSLKTYSSGVQIYKCDNCSYHSKDRSNFRKHYTKHVSPLLLKMYSSEEKTYKCDKCEYVIKDKCSFKKHYLLHTDFSHLKTYKCDKCNYETNKKNIFSGHCKRHKN